MREPSRGIVLALAALLTAGLAAIVVATMLGPGRWDAPVGRVVAPSPPVERRIVFVPLGSFPAEVAGTLRDHYAQRYGLDIELADPLEIPSSAWDEDRGQLMGEALVQALAVSDVGRADQEAVVIGLTDEDLYYLGRPDWRYAFGVRGGTIGVVSSARMHDWPANEARELARLRRFVTKNLGSLYFGLPNSPDPTSVMYGNILGPDDLDRMAEDLPGVTEP